MYKKFSIILWCWIFCFSQLNSQNVIKGIVKNEKQEAVPYATIKLLQVDSTFIQGVASDSIGYYQIEDIKKGKYLLSVSSIGYDTQFVYLSITRDELQLPDIVLKNNDLVLETVEIKAQSFIRQKDRVLIIPDKQQIKHAQTGYDLLSNLMIPNIEVNKRKGTVTTLGGNVSLYINGRKVDQREVKNLRPQDIEKVEYFDAPTGKYAGDVASINYVVKEHASGGYITLDGDQAIGYLKGDYNVAAKISHGNTSYSLFVGYNIHKYDNDGKRRNDETFLFPDEIIEKEATTEIDRIKKNQQYAQLNIVNQNKKRTLSAKVSFVQDNTPKNYQEELVNYSAYYDNSQSISKTKQESLMPSINLYGSFQIKEDQYLEASLDATYTNNKYNRSYVENDFSSFSNVNEDLYIFNPSIKYVVSLKHQNSLGAQVLHSYRISSTSYIGDYTSWQHLWSGETLLFLNYNHRLNNKVFFDGRVGISALQYSLHGHDKYTYISPRANITWGIQLSNKQQLYIGGALGNAYPEINTLSAAEQTVDRVHIKRGNPDLDKINMYMASTSYNLQAGRFNLFGILMYEGEINTALPNFFIENDKLIETYRDNGNFHKMRAGVDLSYKITDALQAKLSGRWQYGLITGGTRDSQNSVYSRLNVNYYWKGFSFNLHGQTQSRSLTGNGIHEWQDGGFGASVSWYHGNWAIEADIENPFINNSETRYFLNSNVYKYDQSVYSRLNQQSGYVKIAYTFDFGKKTSRDEKNIDTNINSAILKAR